MLKLIIILLSSSAFILSIINPAFYLPWSGFISEYLVFWSLIFSLPLFFKNKTYIPKLSLIFLVIAIIPIIQYSLVQIIYFDKAFLSVIYLLSFWLALVVGFNSAQYYKPSLDYFFLTLIFCGSVSCFIAIAQWLQIEMSPDWAMNAPSRPLANMAQPNHLATFLLMGLMSCLYFYENKKTSNILLLIISLLFLTVIALTQSRTAWVSLLFILAYWAIGYKRHILTLTIRSQALFIVYFIASITLLPVFKENALKLPAVNAAERASSGHERIQIWFQALDVIKQQSFWGYGWNQSSFAQYATIDHYFSIPYLSSFHNIALDIIIWCGIPIGVAILLLSFLLFAKAIIYSCTPTQVTLISIISVVLIHALLEYPLSYSYFLLPLGFVIGYLFFTFNVLTFQVSRVYIIFVFGISSALAVYTFKEYSHVLDNIVAAETHEMNERKDKVELPYQMHIFETFSQRANWISLYPCTSMNDEQIDDIRNMIRSYIIPYDLYKFSQLLYFNGRVDEAQRHLDMLKHMYKKDFDLAELDCKLED